ncbi:MAG: hypothetical protein ABJF23_00850 [Bryobacteraceae bacterium]
MRRLLAGVLLTMLLRAQDVDIHLYSEFQRIGQGGRVVEVDRSEFPQEFISPPLIRNGFTTFHVAVTGRPKILYWMAIQTNPADVFGIRVYREEPNANGIPDLLVEESRPLYFLGVMPDLPVERTTQVYLVDVWTPPNAPVDRVRFEVLVKTGAWVVAPMEVRILAARVPDFQPPACCARLPEPQRPADTSVWPVIFSALAGGSTSPSASPGTVRGAILRNAQQDAALVRSFDVETRSALLGRVWPIMFGRLPFWPETIRGNAESYLQIRRRIWTIANDKPEK